MADDFKSYLKRRMENPEFKKLFEEEKKVLRRKLAKARQEQIRMILKKIERHLNN